MPRIPAAISSRRPMLLLAALLVVGGAIAYGATPERSSAWRDREIRIDGSDEEWRGQLLPVPRQRFSLGLINDGDFLYLCLPTKDEGVKAQIGTAGLVVWLDPQGGKKRRFGVHFPVPNPPRNPAMRPRPPRPEGEPGPPPEDGRPPIPGQSSIGVLGPGKNDANLMPLDQAAGIEARVGVHGDVTVYELKVPLARSAEHPYAPDLQPGQAVRLEIETAPLRGPTMQTGPVPGTFGVVIPIGGGQMGRYPVVTEPFDVTMKVNLARGPQ